MDIQQRILQSPLPCSYSNLEGRVLFCNDVNAELLDLNSRHDVCHRKVHDLVENQNFATRLEESVLSVIKDKKSQINLYTFETNQNNVISWLNVLNPDFDAHGAVCGVHGIGVPLAKNDQCFVNHSLSEVGVPTHTLSFLTLDRDFKHPYIGRLTKQERKVLTLVLQGYSCKRIAQKLYVSSRTVESHMCHIKAKFMVKTRDELIDFCYMSGLARVLSFFN